MVIFKLVPSKQQMHDKFYSLTENKERGMVSPLKYLHCSLQNIHCNYLLTTTQGDRFASCENVVSCSQTSSLSLPHPPPPAFHSCCEQSGNLNSPS